MNKYISNKGIAVYLVNLVIRICLLYDKSVFAAILTALMLYPVNYVIYGDIFMVKNLENLLILWYGIHFIWLIVFLINL